MADSTAPQLEQAGTLPWYRKRLAAFDLETTAPDPLSARIVQAAIAFVGGNEATSTTAFLVDAGVEIPADATAIHKITTDQVRATGEPIAKAVPYLLDTIKLALDAGWPLVIYNAPYDLTVLRAETMRLGLPWPTTLPAIIDPLVLDKHFDRYRRGSRKLVDVCRAYGAQLDAAHDACHDALAAARVAYQIAKKERHVGQNSLENLQPLQAEWYREQAKGLDEYFRKNGKPGVDSFDWPIRRLP